MIELTDEACESRSQKDECVHGISCLVGMTICIRCRVISLHPIHAERAFVSQSLFSAPQSLPPAVRHSYRRQGEPRHFLVLFESCSVSQKPPLVADASRVAVDGSTSRAGINHWCVRAGERVAHGDEVRSQMLRTWEACLPTERCDR